MPNLNDPTKGNYLHYNYTKNGAGHSGSDGCEGDGFNLYTSEARFTKPRWVWLYTCNFLTTNAYVDQAELKAMMNGTHILMGYASQAYLADAVATRFATELGRGKSIIEAFRIAGCEEEINYTNDSHIQKVLYISQAEDETIYTASATYNYSASDVLSIQWCINDNRAYWN